MEYPKKKKEKNNKIRAIIDKGNQHKIEKLNKA